MTTKTRTLSKAKKAPAAPAQKPPKKPQKTILFVIAGEPSGDRLGSAILEPLRAKGTYEIQGVGGPLMEAAGQFQSLVPLEKLSVMGLAFIPKLPQLIYASLKIRAALRANPPDILLTIDAPDLTLRLHRQVPATTFKVHCVAPSVWAWRPGRAYKLAKRLDHLLTLLPFEPPYFTKHGLQATFIGHPQTDIVQPKAQKFWKLYPHLDSQKPLLLLMPGSRLQEVKTLWPLFLETAHAAQAQNSDLQVAVLTLPKLQPFFRNKIPFWMTQVDNPLHHSACMRAGTAALVSSGTATLELALAACPMVVAYKLPLWLGALVRPFIHTPFVALPNIMHQKAVVPEHLQSQCTPKNLLASLMPLLNKQPAHRAQKTNLLAVRNKLETKDFFGDKAAHTLESAYKKHTQKRKKKDEQSAKKVRTIQKQHWIH